jgi:hypothetical protein
LRSLKKVSSLDSVRNKDGQRLGYVLRSYLYNCNSLFVWFLPHQVFIFAHTLSFHFYMNIKFLSLLHVFYAIPKVQHTCSKNACRLLQHHFRDIALTHARITDITLSRKTLAPASIHGYNVLAGDLCRQPSSVGCLFRRQPFFVLESALARDKESQKGREGHKFWVHIYRTVSSRPRGRFVQSLV